MRVVVADDRRFLAHVDLNRKLRKWFSMLKPIVKAVADRILGKSFNMQMSELFWCRYTLLKTKFGCWLSRQSAVFFDHRATGFIQLGP